MCTSSVWEYEWRKMAENKEKYKEWNYCFAEWKAEITIDDRRVTSCSACEGQKQKRTPLCPPVGLSCSKCGDSDVASLMANIVDIFVSFPCCGVFCWLLRYPRAHGANLPLHPTVPEVTGSPPSIRGRHSLHKMNGFFIGASPCILGRFFILKYRRYVLRFIPVRTGQISDTLFSDCATQIHPRTHGADRGAFLSRLLHKDSSPYARGRLTYCLIFVYHFRFIPVRTGQIFEFFLFLCCCTDSSPYARGRY